MFGLVITVFLAVSAAQAPTPSGPAPAAQTARPPQPGDVMLIDGVPINGDEYGRWMLDLFGSRMATRFGELNIGHNIVARAVLVGMERAVREMVEAIRRRSGTTV